MNVLGAIFGFCLFLATFPAGLHAEPQPIPVYDDIPAITVTDRLEQIKDPEGSLKFEQLLSDELRGSFEKVTGESVRMRNAVYWYHGIFENPSAQNVTIYLQFDIVSHVALRTFTMEKQPLSNIQETGWKGSFRERPLPTLHPIVELIVPPGKSQVVMRAEGRSFSAKLGSKTAISKIDDLFEAIVIFVLATFFALGLYNGCLFVGTRDPAYLYYSLRCIVISVLTGVSFNFIPKFFLADLQYNFPSMPPWLAAINHCLWLLIAKRFLSLDTFLPKAFVRTAITVLFLGLVLGAVQQIVMQRSDPCLLLKIFNPLSIVWNIGIGVYMCFKRYRPAYFFMFATTIYFAGILTMIMTVEGALPAKTFLYLAPSVTGAIEAILMSFGLGDKYMMYMKAANARLNQKNDELGRDLSFMLRSLNQGIFSVDSSGKISQEHSDHLKSIFSRSHVGGEDAFQMLFQGSDLSRDEIDQIKNAALIGIGEGALSFEMNKHLFPHEIRRQVGEQRQVLEVDWQPLLNSSEVCEKVMVVLRDVTDIKKLEEESEKSQKELRIVGQMLSISIDTYSVFSDNARNLLNENNDIIQQFRSTGTVDLPRMFRNVHTIKGNARTFGLVYIAEVAHDVENYFSEIRMGLVVTPEAGRLAEDLKLLSAIVNRYDEVLKKFLSVGRGGEAVDLIDRLAQLYREYPSQKDVKEKFFEIAEELRINRFFPTLESMLQSVVTHQGRTAAEVAKPVPKIEFNGGGIHLSAQMEMDLRNIFTQMLRNSIDHGIERPELRNTEGKDPRGTISVSICASITEKELVIEVEDDGAGLNIAALAKRQGNPLLSDEELAETIFHPGVSTAEKITHISGRGVGMDIVKALVVKYEGKVSIVFTKPKTMDGRRPFKAVLKFPSKFALSDQPQLNVVQPAFGT